VSRVVRKGLNQFRFAIADETLSDACCSGVDCPTSAPTAAPSAAPTKAPTLPCEDTFGWDDGAGNGCESFTDPASPICRDGAVTEGNEPNIGMDWNYPERHCCACGKGPPTAAPTASPTLEPTTAAPTTAAPTERPTPSTPEPTPEPTEEVTFTVVGPCTVQDTCIMSGNYPESYDSHEECSFTAMEEGELSVETFKTESRYDVLEVMGQKYSGSVGPSGVALFPGLSVSWSTDDATNAPGFKLCLKPAAPTKSPTPLPTAFPTAPTAAPTATPTTQSPTEVPTDDGFLAAELVHEMSDASSTYSDHHSDHHGSFDDASSYDTSTDGGDSDGDGGDGGYGGHGSHGGYGDTTTAYGGY